MRYSLTCPPLKRWITFVIKTGFLSLPLEEDEPLPLRSRWNLPSSENWIRHQYGIDATDAEDLRCKNRRPADLLAYRVWECNSQRTWKIMAGVRIKRKYIYFQDTFTVASLFFCLFVLSLLATFRAKNPKIASGVPTLKSSGVPTLKASIGVIKIQTRTE